MHSSPITAATAVDVRRHALQVVFGDSSSESDDKEDEDLLFNTTSSEPDNKISIWESVEKVKGLWLCQEFLTEKEQSELLLAIEQEGWFTDRFHNQAMRFGVLPTWAVELSKLLQKALIFRKLSLKGKQVLVEKQCTDEFSPFPFDIVQREPLFDQLIVNRYYPGEGICAHVDLLRFEDGIAIISMESPCIMHFTQNYKEEIKSFENNLKVPVLLKPGSLVFMHGEARYDWKHEINRQPGFQIWDGKEIQQQRRTSVTLRKLCPSVE